jgi:RNA polymerase sigma-70 factor, ECF subfamily
VPTSALAVARDVLGRKSLARGADHAGYGLATRVLETLAMVQAISDDEAIWRVRRGDTRSYEVLEARYHRPLQRVARRLMHSEADAEDVLQGAHLLALTHIDQFRGSNYFRWMYSIVVNEARTQMRKGKRIVNGADGCTAWLRSSAPTPEQETINQNVEDILDHAVEGLPPHYQAVFRLRETEDLTTSETGERLGLSDACVKIRLFRAKNLLRKRLGQVVKDADLLRPTPNYPNQPAQFRSAESEMSAGAMNR